MTAPLQPQPYDVLIEAVTHSEFDVFLLSERIRLWASIQDQVCPHHLRGVITTMTESQARSLVADLPRDFTITVTHRTPLTAWETRK